MTKSDKKLEKRQTETRVLELEALFDISNLLSSSLNLSEILNNILFTIMGRMMVGKGVIFLNVENKFKAVNQKGLKIDPEVDFDIDCSEQNVYETDKFKTDEFHKLIQSSGLSLVIPMHSDGDLIGVFALGKKINQNDYVQTEITFLSALGNIAGQAIERALNYHKLQNSNRQLDQKIQQMSTLMEIGQNLNESLDFETILKSISRTLMGQMMLTRHAICYQIGDQFEIVLAKGLEISEENISRICKIEAVKSSSDKKYPKVLKKDKIEAIIPIKKNFEIKGYLICGLKATMEPFTPDELSFLSGLSNNSASSLDNAILFKVTLEKQKLEEELQLAKRIQRELLPSKTPKSDSFELAGSNDSSKQVGGDYYDFLEFNDEKIGLVIADVSGKGAAAALLMSNLQATMHALTENRDWPINQIIEKANNIIFRNTTPEKYITFFYGEFEPKTNLFNYVNAGHNYPLVYRDGEFLELKTGGIILGMMGDMPYEKDQIQLQKDDVLVMYTDGITEAMDENEEEFDEPRLKEAIKLLHKKPVDEIHQGIIDKVFEFSPNANDFDDITLIVLKIVS